MILQQLSDARGVSGNENDIRKVIYAQAKQLADECRVDALGNLICLKRGTDAADGRKVMLAAHMDEIGLMVVGFNGDGTLQFVKVGGIDDRVLLAKRVLIGENKVPGVIGFPPIHLIPRSQRSQAPDYEKMAIDIGASSADEAKKLVDLGDYVSFDTQFEQLTSDGLRMAKGKAFDDRAGCAVLLSLLENDYPFDLYAVFTTQEEVGLRGARVAAYSVAPDMAIVLEGTICDDLPNKRDESPVTRVGNGPAITFMDRSFIADKRLFETLVGTAKELGIPFQLKQAVAGGTDAGAIHLTREGVPAVTVAVPARSIHAPVGMISMQDLEYTVQLVQAALQRL